jgi:hypothetical protein
MGIVGTYIVEVVEQHGDEGQILHPFGERVAGMLVYSADGGSAAVVGSSERPKVVMDLLAGTIAASDAEQAAAFRSAYGFAGTFEVVGDEVHHRILASTVPNWVGTRQIRPYTLDGDLLVLRPPGWRVVARRVAVGVEPPPVTAGGPR